MAEELSAFDKFTRGIPISEELAALHDGRDPVSPQVSALPAAGRDDGVEVGTEEWNRELTRGERLELKELRLSRGWPVLLRLLEKSFHRLETRAITASKGDPLARRPETGEYWMERNMFELAKNALPKLVAQEMEALDGRREQDEVTQ